MPQIRRDAVGTRHCVQLDSGRYAQDVRRYMLNICAATREARC